MRMYIHKNEEDATKNTTQQQQQQHGSLAILKKKLVKRERGELLLPYWQMRNSITDIKNNVSASAVIQSLGFARFNAGAKKKKTTTTTSKGETQISKTMENAPGVIVSYNEYCVHRKLKKLLESGGAVPKDEAERYHVVSDKPIRVFYTNAQMQQVALTGIYFVII